MNLLGCAFAAVGGTGGRLFQGDRICLEDLLQGQRWVERENPFAEPGPMLDESSRSG